MSEQRPLRNTTKRMDKKHLAIVERHVRSIFATWHACALRKPENGLPKGTLCDDCNAYIKAHMEDIRRETSK
jgi:hypothetical protein